MIYDDRDRLTRALRVSTEDAERAIKLIEPLEYGEWIEPAPGVSAVFRNAGHILGAAMIEVRLR